MDQVKIGKFIAEKRKENNLTQYKLAEMLSVTDRAVSKWETGKSLPDSSIMIELCSILKISVNDLLSGEIVNVENYNKDLESKLIEMVKQKEVADRHLLRLECVIGILSVLVLLIPCIIAAYIPVGAIEEWQRVLIVFSGLIPCVIGILYAVKIEQVAGYYECKLCGHKHVPSYRAVNLAMHMGRTRYLKCPNCQKKSWQKKVISKD